MRYCLNILFLPIALFLCTSVNAQVSSYQKEGFNYIEKVKNLSKTEKDSIFYYLDKSYNIATKHQLDTLLLETLNHSIHQHLRYRNYREAHNYAQQLDSLSQKYNDSTALFHAKNTLGRLENIFDNTHKSIEYYKKALEITLTTNDTLKTAILYGNIGNNYMYLEQYSVAEPFFLECLNYFERLPKETLDKSLRNLSMIFVNLVYVYTELNNKEKAFVYLDKAENILKDNYFEGAVELNELKGQTFASFKNYKKAIVYFKRQLVISEKRKDNIAKQHALLNLAELHEKIKSYNAASNYFDTYLVSKASDRSEDILSDNAQIYKIGMNSYKGAKQYKKALKYSELLNKTLDTLHKIEVTKTFAEYGVKYKTEKKEKENEILKKENQRKNLEIDKQKNARNYLFIISLLVLIVLVSVYTRLKSNIKTTKTLAKQNEIISQQKIALENSNTNKQKLFGIIAHDLINPFNAILGYCRLLEEDYNSFSETERKEFIATINKYANSNYNLTRTLLDWAKVQQDKLIVKKESLNFKTIIEKAIQPYLVLADKKQIEVITNIPSNVIFEADQNMMQTVIGNLFVNAIKFTATKGKIEFKLYKNDDESLRLEIIDNGVGMSHEQLQNLFDITKINTVKGTNQETGNGLGLVLCKELMDLQKGTLQLFSQKNKGSKAVLSI
ncbi:MAG: tetratricopeptide repeat-containing sensor histidine kinase [Winogradskyella sp.]